MRICPECKEWFEVIRSNYPEDDILFCPLCGHKSDRGKDWLFEEKDKEKQMDFNIYDILGNPPPEPKKKNLPWYTNCLSYTPINPHDPQTCTLCGEERAKGE